MTSKNQFISIAVAVLVIIIGAVIYYQKNFNKPVINQEQVGIKVSTVNEKEYKDKMKTIFSEIDGIAKNCLDKKQNLMNGIAQTENKLLEVKAPLESFKDLHINLMLALKKLEICPSLPVGEHRELTNVINALAVKYDWVK